MNRKVPDPARGLFRNGKRWWVRVRSPVSKRVERRSTGTGDVRVANAIAAMLGDLAQDRTHGWEWLELVVTDEVSLMDLYTHRVRSTLHVLKAQVEALRAGPVDDLREWVKRWIADALPARVSRRGRPLSQRQRDDYARIIRALIPDDQPVRCAELTEEYVITALGKVDAKPNTKRNYVMAWRLFVRWARRKGAAIPHDPFEFAEEWMPGPGKPRAVVWSHAQRLAVLDQLHGPAKAAIAVMLGSGMELSAALRLQAKDIDPKTRTVFADGSKTDYRSRHIAIDAWAWPIFNTYAVTVEVGRVFPWSEKTKGAALREAFYRAQVRAGLVEKPPTSENGYPLWQSVRGLHTIHDCRSTYAVCRGMGLDGEPPRDNTYLAHQLGHANEAMVTRFYKHLSPARRQQLLAELEEAHRSSEPFAPGAAAV